jgi:DNA-directed RNA polymerase specialized sigma24 family protein
VRSDPFADLEPLVQRVYGYVAYCIGDGSRAESVTAQTFDQAFRHRAAFGPRDKPVPWLVAIARQILSAGTVEASSPAVAIPEPRRTPAPGVTLLLGEQRELVAFRYGAELTPSEIGGLLGRPTEQVEAELERALAQIRSVSK